MNPINLFGGRKSSLVFVAMVIVAAHDWLGLDDATVQQVVYLALGGSGVIALEDALGAMRGKKKAKEG